MKESGHMGRREFIQTAAAAAGLMLAGTAGRQLWAQSSAEDVADLSLHELSGLIRSGEISSTELVQLYLDRIEKFGGPERINAYITVAGEAALRRADELDRLARAGRFQGLLHGLPIAVKDNLDTQGMRTTGGSRILTDWIPPADAHVVTKLKDAGAIILGKTNMHEFAFGITTNNPHYGPTRNPYDLTRIPGGSSGGSGAATAAGLCAGAIGTDTGGSVRIPAALCGVVSLKPTLGRVGRGGLMYLSFTRDVIGPMTRTAIDCGMILEAIAGADARDPESRSKALPDYATMSKGDLRGKKFGLPKKYFFEVIHPDTEAVMQEAVKEIESLGGTVKEVEVKHVALTTPTGFNIVLAECIYHMENYLRSFDPEATIDQYLDQLGPDVRAVLGGQKGTPESKPVPGYVYARSMREDRRKIMAGFEEAMEGLDALILPTTPLPAAKIGEDTETELNGQKVNTFLTFIRNCDPISVVGYPAVTVPAGYSRGGLPIGLQIVARPWEEDKLVAMAHAYEKATRIRKAPSL